MNLLKICNKIIEYSFYALFLLVPLVFSSATSELFELNKMWLTWGLTITIVTAWLIKMVRQRRIIFQRTPLDVPIGLFLLSQIISTIFSWDVHVSLWGYYSRFNGGLLSIISYILLYYAFVTYANEGVAKEEGIPTARTDAKKEHWREGLLLTGPRFVKRLLFLSLISGLIVALWGLPSHFGYDPTCLLFRGTFNVSCWTADFMPTIRIFSTLGQPDWLAAYLAILLPISIIMFIKFIKNRPLSIFYLLLSALFYIDLLFTRARSGILGVWFSLIFFAGAYFWMQRKNLKSLIINPLSLIIGLLLLITFVIGTPINQLRTFSLEGIGSYFQKTQAPKTTTSTTDAGGLARRSPPKADEGGTESGDIRLNVWTGAINAWKNNPIFGTGVETFAFAYYKYKPAAQNLTSEWNFLYNKAHNEYLNYLATTGIVGLGSYLLMIGSFLFIAFKNLKSKIANPKQIQNNNNQNSKHFGNWNLFGAWNLELGILTLALLASYVSILITNFFGFSVVITNVYLFMIPAFVFALAKFDLVLAREENKPAKINNNVSVWQWGSISFIILASLFMLSNLFRFWQADIAYALGYSLDRAGEYQNAYPHLHKAVELRADELVFKDELSINDAIIAAGLLAQVPSDDKKEQTISVATSLAQEAINTSNEIVTKSPNNAVFWKTRVRLFHTLSQIDGRYLPKALEGIEKASILAPQDANIWYNLGVLYGQNNDIKKGIEAMEKTIMLKSDYRDAHYALGLFYRTASLDAAGKVVIDSALQKKAIEQMQYILDHLNPQDAGAQESIKNWRE